MNCVRSFDLHQVIFSGMVGKRETVDFPTHPKYTVTDVGPQMVIVRAMILPLQRDTRGLQSATTCHPPFDSPFGT